ncbi:MAG: hypothetical protein D3903_05345 [Candidatus Electrothrix sp. GM3_4]|nr:hypothetical protein [Candidatus Electrothrix sp. GM3_4]
MMNNLLNKNYLIGALVILLLLTSWWGQSETGANRQLTQDKEAAEAQLATLEAKATTVKTEAATVEAKAAETHQTLQEKTAALTDTEKKLSKAKTTIQHVEKELSTEKAALTTLDKEEKILLKKINELEFALHNTKAQQAQAGSEQQRNIQKTVTAHKEALAKLEKAEARIAQLEKKQPELKVQAEKNQTELKAQAEKKQAELKAQAEKKQAELKAQAEKKQAELKAQAEKKQAELKAQAEAQIAQLEKKQLEVTTEAESLQAQVIGFEKVVEERNGALAEIGSELRDCKVNTKVLLSKITEQENAQQGMQEKIHLMIQDLSAKAAHEKPTSVQQEQPAQAE